MAKNRVKSFLWIDDAPDDRKAQISYISRKLELGQKILGPNVGASWFDQLMDEQSSNIDIIFVDQNLSNKSNIEAFSAGSSLCSVLKAKYSGVPIIGVSVAAKTSLSYSQVNEFTDFFELDQLRDKVKSVQAIVNGFRMLRQKVLVRKREEKRVLSLLDIPDEDKELMRKIIPSDFLLREPIQIAHDYYKWIRNTLMSYQGLLINEKELAASIGLSDEVFSAKIAKNLTACRYAGIFSEGSNVRYWKSLAIQELCRMSGGIETGEKLSRYGLSIVKDEKLLALCPVCGDKFTEVLAYDEDSINSIGRSAAHFRCVKEAHISRPAFFDPIYVLKGASF